jgi:hypothetical protein
LEAVEEAAAVLTLQAIVVAAAVKAGVLAALTRECQGVLAAQLV